MRVVESVGRDLRDGLRAITSHKGYAAAVILALALGIGANTAVYSVLDAVVLNPLPYANAADLVRLRATMPRANVPDASFSVKEVVDLRTLTGGTLVEVAEIHVMYFILLGRDEPERVSTGVVSANYFRTLGVQPLLGRDFREEDDAVGAPAVLLLSHSYWQQQFGGDRSIVGRVFQMNDRAHTVIGVLPPLPGYPQDVQVYMPTSACPFRSNPRTKETRAVRFLSALVRVGGDSGPTRIASDLHVVSNRLQQSEPAAYPARAGYALAATPLHEELTREFRPTLLILGGTAAFLLLVLCCSVAALMLARAIQRERDTTLRSVLGASRLQLFRHFLAEYALLATAGGVIGLLVAFQSLGLLRTLAARFTPRAADIAIDGSVLLFLFAITAVTTVLFGGITTLASRPNPAVLLNSSSRSATARQPVFKALIVFQVAITFALLVGAGLMLRSLLKLQAVETGLRTDNVLTMRVALDFVKHPTPAARSTVYRRLLAELSTVPGVDQLAAAASVPLNEGAPIGNAPLIVDGRDADDGTPMARVTGQVATGSYFRTVGMTLLQGRTFTDADDLQAPGVAIVNRTLAQRYWGDADPIGRRIRLNANDPWMTVVGVVSDARRRLGDEAGDEVYRPLLQQPLAEVRVFARSGVPAGNLQRQLRDAVRRVDPQQPVESFQTLEEVRNAALASPRLTAVLLAVFALIALVISTIGVAGVVSFSVNQRTREFGTVLALGAPPREVLIQVLREGAVLAGTGLVLGAAGALLMSQAMSTMVFGVTPFDPVTFVGVALLLAVVTMGAAVAPARRAASVDPLVALQAN